MAKTRLNMSMRESIKRRLMERAFDHQEKELMARRSEIAKLAFDEFFSPEDQKRAAALPQGWMPTTTTIALRDQNGDRYAGWKGYDVYDLDLPFGELHPHNESVKLRANQMSDGLLEAVEEQFKAERDLWSTKQVAEKQVTATLAAYNWVEDLVSGWPEASSIVHEVVTTSGVLRDLPVVTGLNQLLGLPPGHKGDKTDA